VEKPVLKESVRPKKIVKTTAVEKPEEVVKKAEEVKEPVKKSALYSKLSKKQVTKNVKVKHEQTGTHIGSDFQEAYGEAFGKLSEGEKQYIIDNQEIMRRITQEQLNRLGPVNIPRNLNVNTMNIIEFYLHPNGDISGLKIVDASGYEILDDTSLQTIEYSYHRYPLPKQKTLVRYKVGYYLGGRR
jgi:periplasmic protein TonB